MGLSGEGYLPAFLLRRAHGFSGFRLRYPVSEVHHDENPESQLEELVSDRYGEPFDIGNRFGDSFIFDPEQDDLVYDIQYVLEDKEKRSENEIILRGNLAFPPHGRSCKNQGARHHSRDTDYRVKGGA